VTIWLRIFGPPKDNGDRMVILRADTVRKLRVATKAAGVGVEEYVRAAVEERIEREASDQ
jgi:hypothetical protein